MAKVKLDKSHPQKLVISVAHWQHWTGFLLSVMFVGLSFYFILYYGADQAFVGFERMKRIPSTVVFVVVPLAFLPFVIRNMGWALRGEKVVLDGTTADVIHNRVIVGEFKDVVSVGLRVTGRVQALTLTMNDGREVPLGQAGPSAGLESAGRTVAAFLKRPFHMYGG